jgi:hypothetical protein
MPRYKKASTLTYRYLIKFFLLSSKSYQRYPAVVKRIPLPFRMAPKLAVEVLQKARSRTSPAISSNPVLRSPPTCFSLLYLGTLHYLS